MSITSISFYWRKDTPNFVTWRSRLATAPDTPTCIVIHGGHFSGGVHPPNQLVPEILSRFPCSLALVRHTLLIGFFFPRTYFFHRLPRQMPHQRFQRFDSELVLAQNDEFLMVLGANSSSVTYNKEASLLVLTHSRTTTPFEAPGKQAF